jgi:hypothetical protein
MDQDKEYTPISPHGDLEEAVENVWVVQGSYNMMPGVRIGRTMTIVRRGTELIIFNSIRVNKKVEEEILGLGQVKHLVRLTHAHGCDDAYYKDTFGAGVVYWDMEGEAAKGVAPDKYLTEDGEKPIEDATILIFQGVKMPEAAFLIPDAYGTLITADCIQNGCPSPHASWIGLATWTAMGFRTESCTCPPMWRQFYYNGEDLFPNFERLLQLNISNCITGHGPPKVGDAKMEILQALSKVSEGKGWKAAE